jgi:hypothetical protein
MKEYIKVMKDEIDKFKKNKNKIEKLLRIFSS